MKDDIAKQEEVSDRQKANGRHIRNLRGEPQRTGQQRRAQRRHPQLAGGHGQIASRLTAKGKRKRLVVNPNERVRCSVKWTARWR
jgi:hypothetical protein